MRDSHRHGRLVRGLRIGLVPLCLGLPGIAQGQSFSAGDLATSRAPSMPAAPEGYGEGGIGSLLPNLFDQFGIIVGASERYTDNATGSATAAQSSWVTQGMLGVNASRISNRLSLLLNYGLNVNHFTNGFSGGDDVLVNQNLNSLATWNAVDNHLLVQAQAYASPVYRTRLGNILPSGQALPPGANNDLTNAYGYNIQPDFYFKLGDFLRSDLVPSYAAYYFDGQTGAGAAPLGTGTPGNSFVKSVTERISSGEYFNRVQWGAIASYSEMTGGFQSMTQRSATGELSYAIDHGFSIVGNVGYQAISSRAALRNKLSGMIYMGGFNFNLARLTGQFRAGEQFNNFSMVGNLNYTVTPRTTLFATAQDGVNTPGAALFNSGALSGSLLQGFGLGQIQMPGGLGFGPGNLSGVVGLQNSIARFRSQRIGVNYMYESYTVNVAGFNNIQETQTVVPAGQNGDLRSTGVYAAVGKTFTPDLSGNFTTSYRNESLQVGHADILEFGGGLSYVLNPSTQLYTQGTYFKRLSTSALSAIGGGDVSAVSIMVGITHTIQ